MNGILKILKIDDIKNLSLDTLIEAVRNGYEIEKTNSHYSVTKLATCQTSTKEVGQSTTLSATPSNGTAPYTVNILKDGTVIRQFTNVAANQTVTHIYTFVSGDVGTHTFSTVAYDSCSSGSKTSNTDQCTVTVVSSPPSCGTPSVSLVMQ